MGQTDKVIETTGEVVEDIPSGVKFAPQDIPPYTVARAINWLKAPENAERVQRFSEMASVAQDTFVAKVDKEVGAVGKLFKELMTDDDVLEDFKDSFIKSVFGLDD